MIRGLGGPCASVGNGVAGYGVIGYGVAYGGGERYGVGFKEGFGVGCDDWLGFPKGIRVLAGAVEEDGELLGGDVTLRQ